MRRREFLGLAMVGLAGCIRSGGGSSLKDAQRWGSEGLRDGEFLTPRAIGVHAGEAYVVDKTGRVQVFDESGKFLRLWETPDATNGTPTAIAFANGRVIIPDTHYSRIIEYTRDGEVLETWGHYGNETDAFIYPTGAAVDAEGNFYFSEYGGGAERVHVFDASRQYVRHWGGHGSEPGKLNRAMALCLRDDHVLVADTANHRVQEFTVYGELVRVVGQDDTARLKYPHDVAIAHDGSLLVAEYGNHRISRFDHDGKFMASYGAAGRAPGAFNAPRGVACNEGGRVFVADTDNHRIQSFLLEDAV